MSVSETNPYDVQESVTARQAIVPPRSRDSPSQGSAVGCILGRAGVLWARSPPPAMPRASSGAQSQGGRGAAPEEPSLSPQSQASGLRPTQPCSDPRGPSARHPCLITARAG